MRVLVAVVATMVLGPMAVFFGLLAVLTLIQEVAAGWFDLQQASLTSWLSPGVWFGLESPGGTASIFDMMVGGDGAVGGTAGRFFVFAIAGGIAFGSVKGIGAIWSWARTAVPGGTAL